MSVPHSLFYLSQARAATALMSAVAHGDECVSLLCEPGISSAAVLDEAENELSSHGLRCVRVYGPGSGGLSLRGLVAQIVVRADPDALTDHDLKAGFATLTEPGEGYDRVALLVTEAQNLLPSAMQYIQLACRSSPKLRVALAGQPGLAAALAQDEFALLRQRITRTLELPGPVQDGAPGLLSLLAGFCRDSVGPMVRLGVAAASVLLIAAVGWHHGPAASEAAVRAADAGPVDQAILVSAEPGMAADAPSPSEPAAAPQEGDATAARQAQDAPPSEPAAANASTPEKADAPAGQGPAPPGQPVKPAEDDAARDASPAFALPASIVEPTPDAAPPLRALAVASVPVPPPQPRGPAALPPSDASLERRPRGGAERVASVLPARPANERHCRDIVLHAQSGKDLSDADQLFLRDGCRAK